MGLGNSKKWCLQDRSETLSPCATLEESGHGCRVLLVDAVTTIVKDEQGFFVWVVYFHPEVNAFEETEECMVEGSDVVDLELSEGRIEANGTEDGKPMPVNASEYGLAEA